MQQQISTAYAKWLDDVCRGSIPVAAVAFNVNLYEAADRFQAELIGASKYEERDPDWPCAEVFATRPNLFELPKSVVGASWETALDLFVEWTRAYCLNRGNEGARLRDAQAVAVGFVDGDLIRVWPAEATA